MTIPNKKLLILAGDGIGPEVMCQVRRVIDWFDKRRAVSFDLEEDLIGGCAYEEYGVPLADKTLAKSKMADAVLLGAVGGPKWEKIDFNLQPERGLLRARRVLGGGVVLCVSLGLSF